MMNKNEIEKQALRNLAINRQNAVMKAENNLKYALSFPKYKELYNKIKTLEFEIAKARYNKQDTKKQQSELLKNEEMLKQELKDIGLKQSDFEPLYNCKKCNDTGFAGLELCSCYKKMLSQMLFNNSDIKNKKLPEFKDINFSVFGTDVVSEMKNLYKKLEDYSANLINAQKKIITLIGNTGVGKTYLAECTVNNAINNSFYTVYTTAFALGNEMLSYHLADLNNKKTILSKFLNCDFLVIDDLGSEPKYNNVTEEYLYLIINERLNKNKNTLITTNLDLEQIRNNYGERIFSRIANQNKCAIIKLQGKDLRLKK